MKLQQGSAQEAGLDQRRLDHAYGLLDGWAAEGRVPGAVVAVARHGILLPVRGAGTRQTAVGDEPMPPEAVFLVASVTKPVTATALMLLVERGQVALRDLVCELVPEFTGDGREQIRVLHLLTHTSGLPDMLPDNTELRQRHAPLSEFITRICRVPLLFAPGTRISYQSMGTAMVGEIVERISGMPLREFCAKEIFAPLGMEGTSLGIRDDLLPELAPVCLPAEQHGTDWHWNTPYWRQLGVPWGGMFARARDLVVFLQTFLNGGAYDGRRLMGCNTAAAMIRDQTQYLPLLERADGIRDRWGLGWKLSDWVSELSRPGAFGHSGATGTLVGADPATGLAWVIFTTQPGAPLHYVANALNAAVID
jgi:CubicO group peptidase (beta-lactamase class C family)